LDKKLREQMQIEIKHLHEDLGMTVAYVTHDQGEALTMSDRVAIMNDGLIQQVGTPHQVYEEPANAFVANFVGENNSFEGRIESMNGGECAVRLTTGDTVRARSAIPRGKGEAAVLSLRPERLTIDPDGGDTANRFGATVVEVIYFGAHNRVRLAMAGRDDIIALVPAGPRSDALKPGETVEVGWSPDHCRVLAPE
ncbi:MAG: ABC transporter ATP-binding protein, partial [Alphaproteobacteria bacterium]|nr:ABC transporter ATP-binding protein [Alphaproteobacteria bacterium]